MVVNMMDNLRKFCEENNIECTVERNLYEPVRIGMVHRPTGNSFCKLYCNLDDSAIESTIRGANEIFNLVDVASLYPTFPTFYNNPEWVEARMAKLQKRWIAAEMRAKRPEIDRVIFSGPATIVFWSDGSKTVVKAYDEPVDPEKGLAMAIAKKFLGTNKNKSNYYDVFKEWLPEETPLTIPKMNINWTDKTKVVLAELAGGSPDDSLYNLAGKILFLKNVVEEKEATPIIYLTPSQLAEKHGISPDIIRRECRAGTFPGAKKVDGKWMIPYEGTVKEFGEVTWGDIYNEFKSNYPDFANDVADWRPYGPPYTVETRPMNIVIWLRNGEIKRYSYETKKLYPVEEE